MDKIQFMRLWDLYGGLLTATQREITDMYFNLDLTVSEIAEQKGVSRQSVSDCLNVCKKELATYDEKLGHDRLLTEGDTYTSCILTDVSRWAEDFLLKHPEYASEIAALKEILGKDYSDEIKDVLNKLGK